jgi:hypothetical protein
MKFFYDMHIHSDLSPCGNDDMTPNNIVNMSFIKGLNIISVTDHNTVENLPAIFELCEKTGIKAIPGIEVTTKEEVHVLCYFKDLNYAMKFGKLIYDSLPNTENIPSIFGCQNMYNINDEITGVLNKLLINASDYSLKEICYMAKNYHGIVVPAHINKKSNGILGVLGFIPTELIFNFVEVKSNELLDYKLPKNLQIFKNSDAHKLIDISEAENFIELNDIEDIYDYLKII